MIPPAPSFHGTPLLLPVDLQIRAVDLAYRLGSMKYFLEAARELLTCQHFSATEFWHHGKKIITLIEIARATLTKAGIQLYTFSFCPPVFVPHKTAYVDLLEILEAHQHNFDITLKERAQKLLLHLSPSFTIQRKNDGPRRSPLPRSIKQAATPTKTHIPLPSCRLLTATASCKTSLSCMPPPDVLSHPIGSKLPKRQRSSIKQHVDESNRLWDSELLRPISRQCTRSPSPEIEQEHMPPPTRLLRPLPRRFGIFCTGKNSMHQPTKERAGRPRTRPLTND